MTVKIGFITGARSEYGIAKKLLRELDDDVRFALSIFPTGMHLLKKFGYTVSEVISDGFPVDTLIETYKEDGEEKAYELTRSINNLYSVLKGKHLDAIFVIGDRLEVYAAVLACHFLKIPVIHSGGGAITAGAVDNIYRYNTTYLSTMHLATSKGHYDRLLRLEGISKDHIYFVGSAAVDAIYEFKSKPASITNRFAEIKVGRFALMTFHPVTLTKEPVSKIMDACIKKIKEQGLDILVTYPNNDQGCDEIIYVINKWQDDKNVFVSKSLGSQEYYAALHDCALVVGNSSSGIIEAPYFNKPVLNIGTRQEGRDKDVGIKDVAAEVKLVMKELEKMLSKQNKYVPCKSIYGKGNSAKKIKEVMLNYFVG